jgi:hypothetical protein
MAADAPSLERIVLVRRGEKPAAGLGQLDCQGFNRALALPAVLIGKYGRATAIYAPNPSRQKPDSGIAYDYLRPLATIEPTAIRLGLPINSQIGFDETERLADELLAPRNQAALIFVAWEHHKIEQLSRQLMTRLGGDPNTVPQWKSRDFDSIYLLDITRDGTRTTIRFRQDRQGLDGRSPICPG